MDLEKLALKDKPSYERLKERRRKESLLRDGSHSRNSSISRTPTPDPDGRHPRRTEERTRRGSSVSSTGGSSGARRPRKPMVPNEKSRLSATETLLHHTIEVSPLGKRESTFSSTGSEDDGKKVKVEPLFADEIKQEPADDL
jgi:hypothetical protein